jgi:hypothetical protein
LLVGDDEPVPADAVADIGRGDSAAGAESSAPDASSLDGAAVDGSSATDMHAAGDGADASDGGQGGPPPADGAPAPIVYDGGSIADPAFDDSDWTAFCVGVTGCFDAGTISSCMGRMPQPLDGNALIPPASMLVCVGNASSRCAVVFQCLGAGNAPCDTATMPDSCSGNTFFTCFAGIPMAVDCASLGMVCTPGANNPGCGFGDCYAWQEGQTACVGPNYVAQCHQGRYVPLLDCQVLGLMCGGSPAQCQNMASGCADVDCACLYAPGLQCAVDSTGNPQCSLGSACTPANADTCDSSGRSAQYCNAGAFALYDCRDWQNGCSGGRCTNQ